MATEYNEIVTPLIVSRIIKFLGFKESIKGIGSVNKLHRQILIEATIFATKTKEARLEEPSGRLFCSILNAGRLYPFLASCVDVSERATREIKQTSDTWNLKGLGLMNDMSRLNSAMYTYWKRTPATKTEGSLDFITKNYDHQSSYYSQNHVTTAIERDVIHWRESKVFDTFGVLLERPDGTIVISHDLKQVYLVLGISQSLGSIFPPNAKLLFRSNPNRPHWHRRYASGCCLQLPR